MNRRPINGLRVALSLLVAGCAVGPDFVRPQPPAVDRYTYEAGPSETVAADGQAQAFQPGAQVAADWWRLFNSPRLDVVVAEGIANNPTLQAAQASLRRSQDNLRAGYGVFFPQVDAGFDFTRQRYNPIRVGQALPGNIFNLFTLSATVTYALDVFGGQRRAVEGLRADTDAQRYTTLATYLTLSGNIVNAVIAWAAYRAQIQATEELILAEREQLQLTQVQADAGTVPYSNVLSIQSQLAATVATLPPLRQKLSQTEHLLATLVGRAPAEWMVPVVELTDLTLPRDLPLSLPSELVRQRPDILMAEAQLHSSSAAIGVATAAMFPSFVLTATGGLNNTSTTDLFKLGPSGFWTLGATVTSPLIHGGTLWFQRKAAIAAYEQSLASYRQTVLGGLAQVADTLQGLEHDAQAVEAQSEAMTAAAEALRLIQVNYEAGTANYLQVLIADAQYHQARLGYLQAVAQRLQDTVGLFVALGGGWWNDQGMIRAP
jgi:NodT family efflux transporter outer membrane factor (OMF) lipoprotein